MVVGVSKDSIESHNKFAEKFKLPYVLLSDPQSEVMKKIRRLRQKVDVRQRSAGHDSFNGGGWAEGRCDQALADCQKRRGPSRGSIAVSKESLIPYRKI